MIILESLDVTHMCTFQNNLGRNWIINVENIIFLVMELMGNLDIAYGIQTHALWSEVTMSFLMKLQTNMYKQSIKEVEVRKVVFKDDVPFVDAKQKISTKVDASTCGQPYKIVVGQHNDG